MHICRWGALRPPPAKCILSGACFITMWALSLAAVYLSITHIRMNRVRRLPRTDPISPCRSSRTSRWRKGTVVKSKLRTLITAVFTIGTALALTPTSAFCQVKTVDSVVVVPNPYNVSGRTFATASYTRGLERILFQYVPIPSKISIYTSAGNRVVTLNHDGATSYPILGDSQGTQFSWSGRNEDNQYVNSDVYIYVVESLASGDQPSYGSKAGKFIVIR